MAVVLAPIPADKLETWKSFLAEASGPKPPPGPMPERILAWNA